MTEMIKNEDVHVMEPHPQIQSESFTTPPPLTSPGLSVVKPGSMKRKQTCFLPNSQQEVTGLQRSSTSSSFKERCIPIVEAMREKYGAIDKDCILKTHFMKERIICDIGYMVQHLDKKKMEDLDTGSLKTYYDIVSDAEVVKIDVKWFRERLDEIREAITSNKEAMPIILRRNESMNRVKENKEKLKRLKTEIEMLEKQVNEDLSKTKLLDKSISTLTTKFQHFRQTSLAEGLL